MSLSQKLSHPQIHRDDEMGLCQGKSPPCPASPLKKLQLSWVGRQSGELLLSNSLQMDLVSQWNNRTHKSMYIHMNIDRHQEPHTKHKHTHRLAQRCR